MKTKKLLIMIVVAMFFATGLTYGQHQYRPLPIYRYMVAGTPDNLNVLDSSVASLALDTTTLPYPVCPALTWGGWDTAHLQTTNNYNWTISHYSTKNINELKGNGYKTGTGNIATDQWYISPYFSTYKYTDVTFSFSSSCAKYAGPTMIVMVSTKFRNEKIITSDWDTLSANIPATDPAGVTAKPWAKSGNINLNSYKGDSVCIAFRYTSNANAAATYYVDSIQITGTIAGINEINEAAAMVSVYPNPGVSNVTISNPNMINKIEIYNLVGELASTYENVGKTYYNMNISNLQQGVYFAKIQLKNGITVSKKIIKE